MIYDATDFPMEGQSTNTDKLLPEVDFMLSNINSIQQRIGAKRPTLAPISMPNELQSSPRPIHESVGMPSNITNNIPIKSNNIKPNTDIKFDIEKNKITKVSEEIIFFKDLSGNQYKTIGENLYVLGWQDADVEIRLVNEKTGKNIPTTGKKFQIYGWHLVKKITDTAEVKKISSIDTIDEKLKLVKIDKNITTITENVSSDINNSNKNMDKEPKSIKIKKRLI